MARHDEKTSVDRAKMLSRGDTGDRLAEVDEVVYWGAWLCRQLSNTVKGQYNKCAMCRMLD